MRVCIDTGMKNFAKVVADELKWLDAELTKRELDVPLRMRRLYAESYALYHDALNHLEKEDPVIDTEYGRRQNPYFKVMHTERENCRRLLQEFSLTPLSAA